MKSRNIAYLVGLTFAVAASANFPILITSVFWSKMTTRGALLGGWLGLISSTLFVILGPTVWTAVLKLGDPIFPFKNPALFSMTISFLGIIIGSLMDNNENGKQECAAYEAQDVRCQTGIS